jgi:hypothetical protein
MQFFRAIDIHTDDVRPFFAFLRERNLSVKVAWVTTERSGSGLPGSMNVPIEGKGTVSGELSEEEAAELNAFIIKLEADYWRGR